MGFELSLEFRLRYLIARECPRGLPCFILVHDPPPRRMACYARSCLTVVL